MRITWINLLSDFEKAFDSINHTFIIRCQKHFNFGEDFIRWVKLFYHDSKSCVSNNGNMSNFFPILRGVRQGCLLSTYLFIMCIELLSYKISGAQWLSGRVLNSRPRGRGFEPHRRHCVVVLEQDTFILA